MAENEGTKKEKAVDAFRRQLMNRELLKQTITEGLKSTSGKVRSLAIKMAFKTQEHPFLKQNVIPLIKNDKSKKVLRTLADKITRKDLVKKVKSLIKGKQTGAQKKETSPEAAPAPAEKA